MPQRELFLPNYPRAIEHNITLLTEYYTKLQYTQYKHIANTHLSSEQHRDPRFIRPPTMIPLVHIFINECNPENDIIANKDTIQIENEQSHLYDDTGRYLITISTTRLRWL